MLSMALFTSGGLSFPAKAFERLQVLRHILGQELERDKATEGGVLGLLDHAHAAAAQLLEDAVVRDGLADHSVDAWLSGRLILRIAASASQ
jgi:hypothetical protein